MSEPACIDRLAGYVPAPDMKNIVVAHIKTLEYPFLLREVVEATGLPRHTVNKILSRLIKQRVLTRHQVPMVGSGFVNKVWRPTGCTRNLYLYRFAE